MLLPSFISKHERESNLNYLGKQLRRVSLLRKMVAPNIIQYTKGIDDISFYFGYEN